MKYKYIQFRKKFYPIIPIILNKKIETLALVDSGASLSLFRQEIAEELGINIEEGKRISLEGISGKILIYLHKILIEVEKYQFICSIGFSNEYTASFNLLGRENFFKYFVITFNESKQEILLKAVKK